jgi:hypothetical protein
MQFFFDVYKNGELIATHGPFPAQDERAAWQGVGMGLADYPQSHRIVCRTASESAADALLRDQTERAEAISNATN